MRYLYSGLFYLALPFVFLKLLLRSIKAPEYRRRWLERLGFCPFRTKNCIWVHAVSLGETIAATPFIKALKTIYPEHPILVTNMTPTGSGRVKNAFGNSVLNAYIPYDLPDAVNRFLDRIKPEILIVMETELWPNLFAACKKRNIPVYVMNARLSEKSARGYYRIKKLTQEILSAVTVLASQAQADAERFIALGIPRKRVKVTGNMKFDLEIPSDLSGKSVALRMQMGTNRLIWIAGSTHPGEDEVMLDAHQKIVERFPNALLILVPRHPERFDMVAELIEARKFKYKRRSAGVACEQSTQVFLGDSMGEMLLMYAVSDVACVAGSFANIGGHNVLEPAAVHKPVITGPNVFNFAEISALMLHAQGMVKVNTVEQLAAKVIELFSNQDLRDSMGENAFDVVKRNRGALQKQIDLIGDAAW